MRAPDRASAAVAVAANVIAVLDAEPVGTLGAYVAVDGEVDPAPLVAWADDRQVVVALPSTPPGPPAALTYSRFAPGDALVPGRFSIPEPAPGAPPVPLRELDAVLVPLVLADRSGNRVGSGYGFYDRTFAVLNEHHDTGPRGPLLIGLAYSWQVVDELVPREWDVALDLIVTEIGLIRTGARRGQLR